MYTINTDIIKTSDSEGFPLEEIIYFVKSYKVMDFNTTKFIAVFLKTIIDGGISKLIIDLQNLNYIDSTGIGTLINTAKLLRSKNGDLVLLNVSSTIEEVFQPVNLLNFIKLFNDEQEAQDYLKSIY